VKKALRSIKVKPALLIAVYCGSPSKKELEFLKEKDIATVVIDHHPVEMVGSAHWNMRAGTEFSSMLHTSRRWLCRWTRPYQPHHHPLRRRNQIFPFSADQGSLTGRGEDSTLE
jgi:hypothetical protein